MYNITEYSYDKAKKWGVEIKPSTRKNKKIDIYKDNRYLVSIGDIRYGDYPTYIKTKGQKYADERRKAYIARHKYDKGLAGIMAREILW